MSQDLKELIEKFIDIRNNITSFCEKNPLIDKSLGKSRFIHCSLTELLILGQEGVEESDWQIKNRNLYMRDFKISSNDYYKQIRAATLHKINEIYFQEE